MPFCDECQDFNQCNMLFDIPPSQKACDDFGYKHRKPKHSDCHDCRKNEFDCQPCAEDEVKE